jgi:hypothetical protein
MQSAQESHKELPESSKGLRFPFGASIKLGMEASCLKNALDSVVRAEPFRAEELLKTLKAHPFLAELFQKPGRAKYLDGLEPHTLRVLEQFEKYFSGNALPGGMHKETMRLFLALHDIGKPLAADPNDQHQDTARLIIELSEHLPWGKEEFKLVFALLSIDSIGRLMRRTIANPAKTRREEMGKLLEEKKLTWGIYQDYRAEARLGIPLEELPGHINQARDEIVSAADRSGMEKGSFFDLLTIYHQTDVSAYTLDAGGNVVLDFVFNPAIRLETDTTINQGKLPKRLFSVSERSGFLEFAPAHNLVYRGLRKSLGL